MRVEEETAAVKVDAWSGGCNGETGTSDVRGRDVGVCVNGEDPNRDADDGEAGDRTAAA